MARKPLFSIEIKMLGMVAILALIIGIAFPLGGCQKKDDLYIPSGNQTTELPHHDPPCDSETPGTQHC